MQKIALSKIMREEILRAMVFATTLFVIFFAGFSSLAYAADGGFFGEILNKILVKNWDDPTNDGTVKNSEKLGGLPPSSYIQVQPGQSCGPSQCITGFNPSGMVICQ
ncbi:MAG: hypothetical protein WAW59_03960 [Patescibacteria group bacterium]